jgi:hypothetical protein
MANENATDAWHARLVACVNSGPPPEAGFSSAFVSSEKCSAKHAPAHALRDVGVDEADCAARGLEFDYER